MILRTSVLLGSGEGPKGRIRTLYGGCPEPEIVMERFPHCCGGALKLHVKADDRAGREKRTEDKRMGVRDTIAEEEEDKDKNVVNGEENDPGGRST